MSLQRLPISKLQKGLPCRPRMSWRHERQRGMWTGQAPPAAACPARFLTRAPLGPRREQSLCKRTRLPAALRVHFQPRRQMPRRGPKLHGPRQSHFGLAQIPPRLLHLLRSHQR